MEVRGRRCRESSPERAKVCVKPRVQVVKPTFRRVQVVYYLSRNGHLEHPHFMEVTHPAHHLRLKDVMDRLSVLRGKGMPSLYSWSCKRSYNNGYVWNDLAENDIIFPSEGAECVLKGSEILVESTAEKLHHLQLSNTQVVPDPTFYPKRKPLSSKRHPEPELVNHHHYEDEDDNVREGVEEEEYEEKISYTSSRGVCTDETELQESTQKTNPTTELTLDNSSPPSTTSSTVSDKVNENNTTSKRFEDGDPVPTESILSRNSVLLQLIACGGGSVGFKGKNATVAVVKQKPPSMAVEKSGSSLHKKVLFKTAAAAKVAVEEDDQMIMSCMSENPRFGNLQAEEKEYFSGSIVESVTEERVEVEPRLKKSSSYNEERSCKGELGEAVEEELKRENAVKGKCIPRRKSSSKHTMK